MLTTTYDDNGRPCAARCSRCGESMPKGGPRVADVEELKKWFQKGFEAHLRQKHTGAQGDQTAHGRA
jgi:hypothetical protein